MLWDGLTDPVCGLIMGATAENLAERYEISREEQDEFAVASQNKAEAAQKAGKFAEEIIAVTASVAVASSPGRGGATASAS